MSCFCRWRKEWDFADCRSLRRTMCSWIWKAIRLSGSKDCNICLDLCFKALAESGVTRRSGLSIVQRRKKDLSGWGVKSCDDGRGKRRGARVGARGDAGIQQRGLPFGGEAKGLAGEGTGNFGGRRGESAASAREERRSLRPTAEKTRCCR